MYLEPLSRPNYLPLIKGTFTRYLETRCKGLSNTLFLTFLCPMVFINNDDLRKVLKELSACDKGTAFSTRSAEG